MQLNLTLLTSVYNVVFRRTLTIFVALPIRLSI